MVHQVFKFNPAFYLKWGVYLFAESLQILQLCNLQHFMKEILKLSQKEKTIDEKWWSSGRYAIITPIFGVKVVNKNQNCMFY